MRRRLRAVIGAFADGKYGGSFVNPKTLEEVLGWGRRRRERAQAELVGVGWLRLNWNVARAVGGLGGVRTLRPAPVAPFERSGETAQLISHHSQSQVKSSITTSLTENQIQESPSR